jgi:hypothetical protein
MNKLINWAAAAALTTTGFAFMPSVHADDTVGNKVDRAVDKTTDAASNAADKTKEKAHDAKTNWENGRAYTLLGQVTNASLTKGGLDDLVERFNDADRNRIGGYFHDKNNKEKLDVLDGRIAQFQKDWKAKYGNNFKIHKDDVVFGNSNFTVTQGEIGKDASLAGEKLPPADNVTKDNLNKPKDATGNTAADRNLEKGRNVAYITVAASHDLPELKIPLIHELPDMWKIDVPDEVTGQMLYDNILKHLTMTNEMKDKWPADENEAYRMVAHHVLMGVMNVDENTAHTAGAKLGGETAKPEAK